MSLEDILSVESGRRPHKRVGRGIGSRRGKTCCRGGKGYTARTGSHIRPTNDGGQKPLWMKLPKRGFSNVNFTTRYQVVRLEHALARLEDRIDLEALFQAGLAHPGERVKLVGGGTVDRKLTIKVHRVTASVRQAVEAAGGSVEELDAR